MFASMHFHGTTCHTGSSSASRAARAPASRPSPGSSRSGCEGEGYVVAADLRARRHRGRRGDAPDRARPRDRRALRPHRGPALRRRQGRARRHRRQPALRPGRGRRSPTATSTRPLAYQGAGRGLDLAEVEEVARWATRDLRPHLTVVLDVDPREGLGRFEGRDRIEAESLEFHERARAVVPRPGRRRPRPLPRARRARATASSSPAGRSSASTPLLGQATATVEAGA